MTIYPDKDLVDEAPMSWAATLGFKTLIKLLVEAGADFDIKDENNQTPLWRALAEGHEYIAQLILQTLFDARRKNSEMGIPHLDASSNRHEDAIKLLHEVNSELSQWKEGGFSLQEVVRNRYEDFATLQ